jgi:hypothetical protein
MENTPNIEMLKEIFSQYWQHVRHQETQRLNFMNAYAIITAGIFAIVFSPLFEKDPGIRILLLGFVITLSIIGILTTIAWRVAFLEYLSKANEILEEQGIKHLLPYAGISVKKPVTVHLAFLCFYNLILDASLASVIWFQSNKNICLTFWIAIPVLCILLLGTYKANTFFEKPYRAEGKVPPPIV